MAIAELPKIPRNLYERVEMVGSQVVPGAATETSDTDWLVLTYDRGALLSYLQEKGYENRSGDCYPMKDFVSLRKGMANILVVWEESYFNRFMDACVLAKRLKLVDKEHRVILHKYILYGNL